MIKKIFEDNDILIVNKPSGLVVNRSNTTTNETLQDYLDSEYPLREKYPNDEFVERSGIVHRIDKDTSGLLIVAKTPESFIFIQKQFKERSIKKMYTAVVWGTIKDDIVEVQAPIIRHPRIRIKQAISPKGRESFTRVEKRKEKLFEQYPFTLIDVFPKTGRTHQIRVHLCSLNTPIACDPIYCTKHQYEISSKYFKRLMLHAVKIEFLHPKSEKEITFECLPPKEFIFE